MDFFSSFQSRRKMADLRDDIANQVTTIDSLRRQLLYAQQRLDKALLAVEALVELLAEHEIMSREDIMDRMETIDLRDGKLDGKVTAEVVNCVACNRPISPKMAKCLYCGEERPSSSHMVN